MADHQEEEEIGPFEWVTSAASLSPILSTLGFAEIDAKALHVGSGSSTLGEYLVEEHGYAQVVNIDVDKGTLDLMEQRWKKKSGNNNNNVNNHRLEFQRVDLGNDTVPFPARYFELVMDKSALDCTLCSDKATTGLLCETYRVLKPHGVYFVVSFHHPDLLLSLLQNLPGAHWTVSHQVLRRKMDDLAGGTKEEPSNINDDPLDELQPSFRWSNGSFQPDEVYNKTVNVYLCRKSSSEDHDAVLDTEAVHEHIYETNKRWFQSLDPLVTLSRKDDLTIKFGPGAKTMQEAYLLLFNEEERDHLDFEFFMEDWNAFLESRPTIETTTMTLETAIEFLEEMQ